MSFAARLAEAHAFEDEVHAALEQRGWIVEPYGQALLTPQARRILGGDAHAQHRWLPDLIAYHERRATRVLIDAKAGDGPSYAVEKSALSALSEHEGNALMPLYIVFRDWRVVRACELMAATDDTRICRTGPPPSRGSGTPYWLFRKGSFPRTFDNTFGRP
jgi:hypothetical protein